jgi:hypothetical protein
VQTAVRGRGVGDPVGGVRDPPQRAEDAAGQQPAEPDRGRRDQHQRDRALGEHGAQRLLAQPVLALEEVVGQILRRDGLPAHADPRQLIRVGHHAALGAGVPGAGQLAGERDHLRLRQLVVQQHVGGAQQDHPGGEEEAAVDQGEPRPQARPEVSSHPVPYAIR